MDFNLSCNDKENGFLVKSQISLPCVSKTSFREKKQMGESLLLREALPLLLQAFKKAKFERGNNIHM